jgi:peroxiredoxin
VCRRAEDAEPAAARTSLAASARRRVPSGASIHHATRMTTAAIPQRPPQPGEHAPDFTLRSTSGEQVTLSDFRGRQHVLLAFFPLAFTSVCTAELCAFSDDYDRFATEGVAVLPVSVDSTASLGEFKRKHDMRTDLLSDFKREASRAFGVLDEDRFTARRSYFLIDKAGVVRWTHVEQRGGQRRENAELLDEIRKLA